ncbi:MAG: hypothetical protein PHT49_07390 [Desulfovibrionales bacterium]|nr:hypothetical protein [Desulfovibrionales bacterium]
MSGIIVFILGVIGGFFAHSLTTKVSFKQRTIDNKIKVYNALITQWVRMRNFIYAHFPDHPADNISPEIIRDFDQMYGNFQALIAKAILVCEAAKLTDDINTLNERMYRTEWHMLTLDEANEEMEDIKRDALEIVARMREDIKKSARFEFSDFSHMLSGFRKTGENQ